MVTICAKTPGRLTPAGRDAGHAGASPVTLPVCDVAGMFFYPSCEFPICLSFKKITISNSHKILLELFQEYLEEHLSGLVLILKS